MAAARSAAPADSDPSDATRIGPIAVGSSCNGCAWTYWSVVVSMVTSRNSPVDGAGRPRAWNVPGFVAQPRPSFHGMFVRAALIGRQETPHAARPRRAEPGGCLTSGSGVARPLVGDGGGRRPA